MKKVKTLLFPFLTILLGGFIYVSFRVESLRMFSWFNSISLSEVIIRIRNYTLNYDFLIPDWVKFSLPDGLWLFSFISLILITWKNEINSSNLFWLIGLPIIALLSEIGQSISIVPGTFDWIDIAMYLFGFMLPFIINKKSLIIKL
ncbi:hypothetical protein [Flavobacterium sp.]|uniref:hypothetical protein n=1 Tax=Flavobacterium sp. TaxID=239 RepID=UPI002FDE6DFE